MNIFIKTKKCPKNTLTLIKSCPRFWEYYNQKDEIALVVDCLDYSRVNSCTIYTLCKNHLKLLKQFQIHEDAFNFNSKKAPVFYEIKEFLERRDGIWIYKDYAQIDYDNPEDVGKMLPLKLGSCN
jgi:hypothetical protein